MGPDRAVGITQALPPIPAKEIPKFSPGLRQPGLLLLCFPMWNPRLNPKFYPPSLGHLCSRCFNHFISPGPWKKPPSLPICFGLGSRLPGGLRDGPGSAGSPELPAGIGPSAAPSHTCFPSLLHLPSAGKSRDFGQNPPCACSGTARLKTPTPAGFSLYLTASQVFLVQLRKG